MVAAGKAIAAKTKEACEAQKRDMKPLSLLQIINLKKRSSPAIVSSDTNTVIISDTDTKNVLTTTQWLSDISIVINFNGGGLI